MEFSVVEIGYDQDQVDRCLEDLGTRLARLAARTDAAARTDPELARLRAELSQLGESLSARPVPDAGPPSEPVARQLVLTAEREAAQILARARADLEAARAEARLVRDQVYAEAVQARRDFETALHARRIRAERADEILRGTARPGDQRPAAHRSVTPDGALPAPAP
ncbi:ATPase [Micromonospora sp. WMMD1102]|uniref:ATPase n=1 Tax=Micromonospora sp. WMMD1102 TaxID=3016105 RepID=UPI002414FA3E|nr:ATPase [Micromonospora sp. WMMD1102]MDG4787360.1 ATPase [Micromonospora sp. WMMD1102]